MSRRVRHLPGPPAIRDHNSARILRQDLRYTIRAPPARAAFRMILIADSGGRFHDREDARPEILFAETNAKLLALWRKIDEREPRHPKLTIVFCLCGFARMARITLTWADFERRPLRRPGPSVIGRRTVAGDGDGKRPEPLHQRLP
jgi:hypothetical protein